MYLAAGQLAARLHGRQRGTTPIRERIFKPLGMRASNTSVTLLDRLPNVATPHDEIDDTVRTIPYFNLDASGAGRLDQLQRPRHGAVGPVPARRRESPGQGSSSARAAFEETHIAPDDHSTRRILEHRGARIAHLLTYGMGWMLHDYHGRLIVQHGGNIDGMSALVALMPEEQTGLVVLTNLDQDDLTYALMYRVFDAYLKRPAKDWSASMLKAHNELEAQAKQEMKNQRGDPRQRHQAVAAAGEIRRDLQRHRRRRSDSQAGELRPGATVRQARRRHLPLAVRHLPGQLAAAPPGKGVGHLCPRRRRQGRGNADGRSG